VALAGSGADPDDDPLTFDWDLDDDGTFETPGQSPTFSAAGLDGPSAHPVALRVCDDQGACHDASATVDVANVAPAVDAGPDATIVSSESHTVNASFTDPGLPDTHTATVDWGDGSPPGPVAVSQAPGSGTLSTSHQYFVPVTYLITVCVTDDDGDTGCDDLQLQVEPLEVTIDIKPGSDPNAINAGSPGLIAVAVLTDASFDASNVDPLTVAFGPTGAGDSDGRGNLEDVDGDGDLDLVLHFQRQDTGIACGDTSASLTGRTFGGQHIAGSDAIVTVSC
jgi:hypothetical protein